MPGPEPGRRAAGMARKVVERPLESQGDAPHLHRMNEAKPPLPGENADARDAATGSTSPVSPPAPDDLETRHAELSEAFAESLLPVKDSLEAAIAIPSASPEQLLEGVHATLRQLSAALERNKVVEINPAPATRFDPHRHEAISVVPAAQEPNTVVAVLQKGYLIADRVLRPALVTVSAAG